VTLLFISEPMEGTRTSLRLVLVLLLSQIPSCPSAADQNPSTEQPHANQTEDRGGATEPGVVEPGVTEPGATPPPGATEPGATRAAWLIDAELGLLAAGSAGALIACLLVTTAALACQICILRRRIHAPRISRSNMDPVSGAGYWAVDRDEEGGLAGPCGADVVLEEVRADGEGGVREAEEQVATATGYEEEPGRMQSSRDSVLEMLRDLEDTPLVV